MPHCKAEPSICKPEALQLRDGMDVPSKFLLDVVYVSFSRVCIYRLYKFNVVEHCSVALVLVRSEGVGLGVSTPGGISVAPFSCAEQCILDVAVYGHCFLEAALGEREEGLRRKGKSRLSFL